MKKSVKNKIPTILTIARIILVVPAMIFMLNDGLAMKVLALVFFVLASITDFVDGRLARKWKVVTDLGAFLDPLADKMLVNLTLLVFTVSGVIPIWMFAVILVRDFAVDGMRMMVAKTGTTVSASIFGKAKTMVQMITLTLLLANEIFLNKTVGLIGLIMMYAVIILTIYSGVDYLTKGWKKAIK